MKIEFPTKYDVSYPEKNKKYYGSALIKPIIEDLIKSCDGYCMYCGKDINVDNEIDYNIEHSIEKAGYYGIEEVEYLKHCKFNFSICCAKCNQMYKTRMIEKLNVDLIQKKINCLEKECKEPCEHYENLRAEYFKINSIILQPKGIYNEDKKFNIYYNLLNHIFEPEYSKMESKDVEFIREHICRFHLNRERFTECILDICEKTIIIIDNFGVDNDIKKIFEVLNLRRYSNVIGKKFVEYLMNNVKSTEKLRDMCELIFILYYI